MGKHAPRTTAQPWTLRGMQQIFVDDLLRSGFPSDDDLDRLVGLDKADPLRDGPTLLEEREEFGLSAQDIAELFAFGWLNVVDHGIDPSGLLDVIAAGFPGGSHRASN